MLFHRNSTCFLLRILLVFLCFVLFYWIIGCVWSSALFVFVIFAALLKCCFQFCRQAVLFFCGVGCLMWVGLSILFCGGNKPMGFCCFVLQQMLKPLLHGKTTVRTELFLIIYVRLRYFYLYLCCLSLCARTQSMQNCANLINLCAAKPTVELFVATIFQFSARLSVKDLLFCAAGSDDSV